MPASVKTQAFRFFITINNDYSHSTIVTALLLLP